MKVSFRNDSRQESHCQKMLQIRKILIVDDINDTGANSIGYKVIGDCMSQANKV